MNKYIKTSNDSTLTPVIKYLDKMIDAELNAIKTYNIELRTNNPEGDWNNLIFNALDKIKEHYIERTKLINQLESN